MTVSSSELREDGSIEVVVTRTGDLSLGAGVGIDYVYGLEDGSSVSADVGLVDALDAVAFQPGEETVSITLSVDPDAVDPAALELGVTPTHAWTIELEDVQVVPLRDPISVDVTPAVTDLRDERQDPDDLFGDEQPQGGTWGSNVLGRNLPVTLPNDGDTTVIIIVRLERGPATIRLINAAGETIGWGNLDVGDEIEFDVPPGGQIVADTTNPRGCGGNYRPR